MRPICLIMLCFASLPRVARAQDSADPVKSAIAQGDLYQSKHKYELAQDAYRKADKLSHHTSADAYLKLSAVDKKLGDFSSALDEAKKAVRAAGDNKTWATQAHLAHANLLVQMSSKPGDKKLQEAEADIRQALALNPSQAIAHFNLGYVLLKQGRDAEGIAELQTYVSAPGVQSGDLAQAHRMIANPIRAREPFAPDFSFTSHEKQLISNSSLRGKVVLLDFWGTWCPPCRESVPTLRDLQKKYAGKGFELVSVSSDDDEDVWRTFIEAQKMNWSEYIDMSGEVLSAFNVESFPTYVVLDKDGVMRFRQSGFAQSTEGEMVDAINKALKRASDPNLAAAAATDAKEKELAVLSHGGSSGTNSLESESNSNRAKSPDAETNSTLVGIEGGLVSGTIYQNEALSLAYEFPRGWIPSKPDVLHALNEKLEATAKASILQQHPEAAGNLRIMTPKIVFYASRRGDGDGQRLSFPCIRIMTTASRATSLELDTFQRTAEAMANASGAKLSLAPAEYRVKDHPFMRADFERSMGGQHILQTHVQTLSEDYLLTIEIYALSGDDKQVAVDSLQKLIIDE
jgi:thiol-disulfide isomerase/thioredoxin